MLDLGSGPGGAGLAAAARVGPGGTVVFGVPFPPPNVRGPFSLADSARLGSVLEDGGLGDVRVERIDAARRLPSLDAWWERIPKLAGPLAMALEGMEPDVRGAIAQRARRAAAQSADHDGDQVVLPGLVLIGAGRKAES